MAAQAARLALRQAQSPAESEPAPAALPADPVRRVGRALVGMDELDLVVEGAVLRRGAKGDSLPGLKQLLAVGLEDERTRPSVTAQQQAEDFGLYRNVVHVACHPLYHKRATHLPELDDA